MEDVAAAPALQAAKATKAKAKPKAPARDPLVPNTSASNVPAAGGEHRVKDVYQKMSQIEHVLKRPDMYVGVLEKQQQAMWIHDGGEMVQRTIDFAPGLYKIFDEVLVNAADHSARNPPGSATPMSVMKVVVDKEGGTISVWNNGPGIPVRRVGDADGTDYRTAGGSNVEPWVPQMIFGELLTGSNYDDNEQKTTGGRNGYGAKLANIYSSRFVVETSDGRLNNRSFKQVFRDNMGKADTPQIKELGLSAADQNKDKNNWTQISFTPELFRFGMDELEDDTVALMRKRVYDMAGVLGKVEVYWNGTKVPVKDFKAYCGLYLGPDPKAGLYEKPNDRWEVCVAPTDGPFQQVSFCNAICTSNGGKHVDYVTDQISKYVVEAILKKNKKANIKPYMVKNHLRVFVNARINNPTFDSQTKDTLTLKVASFGSKCELSDKLLKQVAASGVMDLVLSFAKSKEEKGLKKGDGAKRSRLVGIAKLDDANDAGTKHSRDCTLILTEGDSAKTLAVAGLSVVGRDRFGVFPLRGKLLNVRDASALQITNNTEIQNIKQIMGLQHGKDYKDTTSLRYGHIMIMTDQDHDGSHIKGLLMNFMHHFYPSLLKVPGFLIEFITPIVKARKGNNTEVFYTMPQYEAWKQKPGSASWKIKYYKGLGTSNTDEAREYFSRIDKHRKEFEWQGETDGDAIQMAFSKKAVEDRKTWLSNFVPGTFLDSDAATISYSDFVHKELILFSRADLERSIPSMVDGLKPGQRKIMFSCFKRNLKDDIKVAQLAGYVSEHAAYHHGEASLAGTIVGLAQDFVGSNNINLLVPSGQFGSRVAGGKDASSPRYIFTRLAPLARHVFNKDDDCLLAYLNEEGLDIEPEWYMPVLPLVLVNGAEGIGTGWSTTIPNYNPRDVVANLKALLDGRSMAPMQPWYKGFRGTVHEIDSKTAGKSYAINGTVYQLDERTMQVTELPVRRWTQDYKEFLEGLIKPDTSEAPLLVDFRDNSNEAEIKMTLQFASTAKAQEVVAAGPHNRLKLTTKMSIGNMMLFDAEGKIRRYETPEQIVQEFFDLRLSFYAKRKAALLKTAEEEMRRLSNQVRFIRAVRARQLDMTRKAAAIEAQLDADGYDRLLSAKAAKKKAGAAAAEDAAEDEDAEDVAAAGANFDYLLDMALKSLTEEKAAKLEGQANDKADAVAVIQGTDERDLWRRDLDALLETLDTEDAKMDKRASLLAKQKTAAGGRKGGKARKAHGSDDDSDEDFGAAKKAPKKKAAPKKAEPDLLATNPDFDPVLIAPVIAELGAAPKPKRVSKKAAAAGPAAEASSGMSMDLGEDSAMAAAPSGEASEPSLLQRVTGGICNLAMDSAGGPPAPPAAPKPRPQRPAAKKKPVVISSDEDDDECISLSDSEEDFSEPEDDSDFDEVNSPPAARPKAKVAAKTGTGKAAGAAAVPAAKAAPAAAAKPKAAPVKRKPAEKAVLAASSMDVSETVAESPMPAPKGKVQRMRPSPFHKGSGEGTAAAAAVPEKPAAAKKPAARSRKVVTESDDDDDSDVEETAAPVPTAAAGRARRAVAAKSYALSESEDEGDDSDFAESP